MAAPPPSLTTLPNQVLRSTCLLPSPGLPCVPPQASERHVPNTLLPRSSTRHLRKACRHRRSQKRPAAHWRASIYLGHLCYSKRLQSSFLLCVGFLPQTTSIKSPLALGDLRPFCKNLHYPSQLIPSAAEPQPWGARPPAACVSLQAWAQLRVKQSDPQPGAHRGSVGPAAHRPRVTD